MFFLFMFLFFLFLLFSRLLIPSAPLPPPFFLYNIHRSIVMQLRFSFFLMLCPLSPPTSPGRSEQSPALLLDPSYPLFAMCTT